MKGPSLPTVALAFVAIAVPSCRSTHGEFPSDRAIPLQRCGATIVGFSSRNPSDAERLGDNHGLFVLSPAHLTFQQILSYGRHLTVYWNREQTCLAIIDSQGSNRQV